MNLGTILFHSEQLYYDNNSWKFYGNDIIATPNTHVFSFFFSLRWFKWWESLGIKWYMDQWIFNKKILGKTIKYDERCKGEIILEYKLHVTIQLKYQMHPPWTTSCTILMFIQIPINQ